MRRFVFRVDSSITIGTGHVYRCRVLARLLKKYNAEVLFVCRSFEGNLINLLSKEFEVLSLPSPAPQKQHLILLIQIGFAALNRRMFLILSLPFLHSIILVSMLLLLIIIQ